MARALHLAQRSMSEPKPRLAQPISSSLPALSRFPARLAVLCAATSLLAAVGCDAKDDAPDKANPMQDDTDPMTSASGPSMDDPPEDDNDSSNGDAGSTDVDAEAPSPSAAPPLELQALAPLPTEQHCLNPEDMMELRGMGDDDLERPMEGDGGVVSVDILLGDAGMEKTRLWAPELLSETGCFEDTATLKVAKGIFRYEMNSPLWTDGAIKERYVALPPDKKIEIGEDNLWHFPIGSVLIKNFIIEFEQGNAASRRPVETRLGVHAEDRWHFFSYQWNEEGTDATLLDEDVWEFVPTTLHTESGEETFEYLFPNEASCRACHNGDHGVIGPRTEQLNRQLSYDGKVMNQLDALEAIGAFKGGLSKPAVELPAMPNPADENETLERRARSYLDANCGHCHRPDGWVPAELHMDLRFNTALQDMDICNEEARYGNIFLGAKRISAGNSDQSVLWQRMQDLGFARMPMLGTLRLDPTAEVVAEWIDSLEDCVE